nr:hypothetical protein BaRGS_026600 [Batillaria attramentaria]
MYLQPQHKIFRSDDTSAWEPVVSQISSQVTQMNAEIQTLKTVNQQQDEKFVQVLVLVCLTGCAAKKPAKNEQDPILQRLEELERRVSEQDKDLKRQKDLEKRVNEQDRKLLEQDAKLILLDTKLQRQEEEIQSQKQTILKLDSELQQLKTKGQTQDIKLQRQEQEIQDRKETILNLDSELQQLKTKQHASDGPGFTGQHVPDKEIQKRSDDTSAWEPVVSQMSSQMTQMNAEIQVLKTVNQQQDQRISQSIGTIGGSWYNDAGAASNYLCLPPDPVFGGHSTSVLAFLVGCIAKKQESEQDPILQRRLDALEKRVSEQEKDLKRQEELEKRVLEQDVKLQELNVFKKLLLEKDAKLLEQGSKLTELEDRVFQQDIKLQRQEQEIQDQKEAILKLGSKLQQLKTKQHTDDGPEDESTEDYPAKDEGKQKRSDDTSAWEPVVSQMSSQMTQMNAEIQVLKTVNQQQDQTTQNAVNKLSQAIVFGGHSTSGALSHLYGSEYETISPREPTMNLVPRSDDTSAWEPVVSQISSQMTQMNAEIQVLKKVNQQQDQTTQNAVNKLNQAIVPLLVLAFLVGCIAKKPARNEQDPILQRLEELERRVSEQDKHLKRQAELEKRVLEQDAKLQEFDKRLLDKDAKLLEQDAKLQRLSELEGRVQRQEQEIQDQKETILKLDSELQQLKTKQRTDDGPEEESTGEYPTKDEEKRSDDTSAWEPVVSQISSQMTQLNAEIQVLKTATQSIEYSGYLMAGAASHTAASEYICVDSAMEYVEEQETKIQQLEQEIRDQKEVEKRVTEQEAKIQQLKQEIRDQKGIENRVTEQEMKIKQQERESREQKDAILLLENQLQRMRTEKQKRSDDTSAWEPVVSQMSSQMTQMNAEIQVLKTVNQQQDQTTQNAVNKLNQAIGTSYVRWGHGACPNSSEIFYSVFDGHSGAHASSHLYGSEYETGESTQDLLPKCAVCRTPRSASVMRKALKVKPDFI